MGVGDFDPKSLLSENDDVLRVCMFAYMCYIVACACVHVCACACAFGKCPVHTYETAGVCMQA